MDLDTTQNNAAVEDCTCGCKDGVCLCENCTNQACDCSDCKAKLEAPAETPAA